MFAFSMYIQYIHIHTYTYLYTNYNCNHIRNKCNTYLFLLSFDLIRKRVSEEEV